MQPRLDKKPVGQITFEDILKASFPLRAEAFAHVTLPKLMDDKHHDELKALYNGQEPDHALQEGLRGTIKTTEELTDGEKTILEPFNEQFNILINHLKETCKLADVKCDPPELNGQHILDLFCQRFLSRKEHVGQSNEFYSLIKQSLESIAIPLRQLVEAKNDKSLLAKAQLEELVKIILNCAPGITKHTNSIKLALFSKDSIEIWLARLRRTICEEFISNHIQQNNIHLGNQPHAYTLFLEFACAKGLNPLGAEEFKKVKEVHGDLGLNIDDASKQRFLNHFISKYTPSAIMRYIAENIHHTVQERFKAQDILNPSTVEYSPFIESLADVPLIQDNSAIIFDESKAVDSTHLFKEAKKDKTTGELVLVPKHIRMRSIPEIMIQITNYYVNRFAAKKGNALFDTVMGDVEKDLIRDDKGDITDSKYSYYLTPGSFDVSYIVENETAQITSFRTAASQGIFPSTEEELKLISSHKLPIFPNYHFDHLVKTEKINDFSNQTLIDINFSEFKINDKTQFNETTFKNVTVTPNQFIILFNRGINIEGCHIDVEKMDVEEILAKNSLDKGILLIHAIHTDNSALVTLLTQAEEAKKCADLSIKYKTKTALGWATNKGQVECIEGILRNTAPEMLAKNVYDIQNCFEQYVLDKNNYQPRASAQIHKNPQLVKLFVAHGALPDGRHAQSTKLLPIVACTGDLDLLKYLINSGASIDQKDNDGETALMWAAYRGHKDVVEYLLDNNANLDATTTKQGNYYGWDAIQWANHKGHQEIADMISDKRAKNAFIHNIKLRLSAYREEPHNQTRYEALARLKAYAKLVDEQQDHRTVKEVADAFFQFARRLDDIDDYAKKVATLNEKEAKHQGRNICIKALKEHTNELYREFLTVCEQTAEKKEESPSLGKKLIDLLRKDDPLTILDEFMKHDKFAQDFLSSYEKIKDTIKEKQRHSFFELVIENLYNPGFVTPKNLENIMNFDAKIAHDTWYHPININANPLVQEAFNLVDGHIRLSYDKLHTHLTINGKKIDRMLQEEIDKIKQMQQKFISFAQHKSYFSFYNRLNEMSAKDLMNQFELMTKSFICSLDKFSAETSTIDFDQAFKNLIQYNFNDSLSSKDNYHTKSPTTYIHKNPELVKLFLAHGADIYSTPKKDLRPIHIAANYGDLDLLKILIAANSDINQTDLNGDTALMWAACRGHKDMVRYLLDNNADLNKRTIVGVHCGKDAIAWARYERHNEVDGHNEIAEMIQFKRDIINDTALKLERLDWNIQIERNPARKDALTSLKLYGKLVQESKDSVSAKRCYDTFCQAFDKLANLDTYAKKVASINERELKHPQRDIYIKTLKDHVNQSYRTFLKEDENKGDQPEQKLTPLSTKLMRALKENNPSDIVNEFIRYNGYAASFVNHYEVTKNIKNDPHRLSFLRTIHTNLYDPDYLTGKNLESIIHFDSTVNDKLLFNTTFTNQETQQTFNFVTEQIGLAYDRLERHLLSDQKDIDARLQEETRKIQDMKRKFNLLTNNENYAFYTHLNSMVRKQEELTRRGCHTSANVAQQLIDQLKNETKAFLTNANNNAFDIFRNNCLARIQASKNTLERHRGWKALLGNMTMAILCVSVACAAVAFASLPLLYIVAAGLGAAALYTVAVGVNYGLTRNVGFFRKTNTIELVKGADQQIRSLEV